MSEPEGKPAPPHNDWLFWDENGKPISQEEVAAWPVPIVYTDDTLLPAPRVDENGELWYPCIMKDDPLP